MKAIAFICILNFAAHIFAYDFIFKTESFVCNQPQIKKIGSGVLFQFKNRQFIVTSDHVIYHGDDKSGICHKAYNKNSAAALDFLAAHIGKGLALLELKGKLENVKALTDEDLGSATAGIEVQAIGYPYNEENIGIARGQIFNPSSSRHDVALAPSMIEVNAHSEFGMSGGALLTYKDDKFLGLLSHQYLREKLGQPPGLGDFEGTEPTSATLIALAIPAQFIMDWVKNIVSSEKKEILQFDLSSQLKNKEEITIDHLHFEFENCHSSENINGGDGAGIGGIPGLVNKSLCDIKIKYISEVGNSFWPFKQAEWFSQLKAKLKNPLNYALYKSTWFDSEKMRRPIFNSLSDFFKALELQAVPLGQIYGGNIDHELIVAKLQQSFQCAKKTFETIQFEKYNDLNVFYFYNSVRQLFDMLNPNAPAYEFISDNDLRSTIDSLAWNVLFSDPELDTIKIADMRTQITIIKDQLNLIRVRP